MFSSDSDTSFAEGWWQTDILATQSRGRCELREELKRFMTRLFLTLLAITALVQAADAVDAVRAAAAGWRQGSVKQDQSALDRFLADDLVYTHGGGKTQSKAEYIADVTNGPSHYQAFSESDINIRFYGKTAVLTGFVDVKPTKGEPYRVRTLEVYLEREGRWQLAQKESVRVEVQKVSTAVSH